MGLGHSGKRTASSGDANVDKSGDIDPDDITDAEQSAINNFVSEAIDDSTQPKDDGTGAEDGTDSVASAGKDSTTTSGEWSHIAENHATSNQPTPNSESSTDRETQVADTAPRTRPKSRFAEYRSEDEAADSAESAYPSEDNWDGYNSSVRETGPDGQLPRRQEQQAARREGVSDWRNDYYDDHKRVTADSTTGLPQREFSESDADKAIQSIEQQVNPENDEVSEGDILTDDPTPSNIDPDEPLLRSGPGLQEVSNSQRLRLDDGAGNEELVGDGALDPQASHTDRMSAPSKPASRQQFDSTTVVSTGPTGSQSPSVTDDHIESDRDLMDVDGGTPRRVGATLASQERREAELQASVSRRKERLGAIRAFGVQEKKDLEATRAQKHRENSDEIIDGSPDRRTYTSVRPDYRTPQTRNLRSLGGDYSMVKESLKSGPIETQFNESVDKVITQTGVSRAKAENKVASYLLTGQDPDSPIENARLESVEINGDTAYVPDVDMMNIDELGADLAMARRAAIADCEHKGQFANHSAQGALARTEGLFQEFERGGLEDATVVGTVDTPAEGAQDEVFYVRLDDQPDYVPDIKVTAYSSHSSPTPDDDGSIFGHRISEGYDKISVAKGDRVTINQGKFTVFDEYTGPTGDPSAESQKQLAVILDQKSTYDVEHQTSLSARQQQPSSEPASSEEAGSFTVTEGDTRSTGIVWHETEANVAPHGSSSGTPDSVDADIGASKSNSDSEDTDGEGMKVGEIPKYNGDTYTTKYRRLTGSEASPVNRPGDDIVKQQPDISTLIDQSMALDPG